MTDFAKHLLFSAIFGVQAGGNSGPDNIAKCGNDLQQAHALALTINQTRAATPSVVSPALSQAIATSLQVGDTEEAALLIVLANSVNLSSAVPIVAQGFREVRPYSCSSSLSDCLFFPKLCSW